MAQKSARTINAVQISLDIIESLQDLKGATVSELDNELEYSISTIHNHLNTLQDRNFVVKDSYEYRPGVKLLGIGEHTKQHHLEAYKCGRSVADDLAEKTGELVWLNVWENESVICVHKRGGEDAVDTGWDNIGDEFPITRTAGGKVVLAHLPEDQRQSVLERVELREETSNSITDEDILLSELEEIREAGVAFNHGESFSKIRGVAAPIITDETRIHGSLSVSGPKSRVKESTLKEELPEMVKEAANIIEIKINNELKT